MNTASLIEKHEQCIRILEAIDRLNNRIQVHIKDFEKVSSYDLFNQRKYYKDRIKIDRAMIKRLESYYKFKTL